MALKIDKSVLYKLDALINEFALEAEEIIGLPVSIEITSMTTPSGRNLTEEDYYLNIAAHAVMQMYDVSLDDLKSKYGQNPLPDARGLAYKAVKTKLPNIPMKKIGDYFGGRDRTTIMSAIQRIDDLIEYEKPLAANLNLILEKFHVKPVNNEQ